MAYNFDQTFVNNLQLQINNAIGVMNIAKALPKPNVSDLLTDYLPLDSTEKPDSLNTKLVEAADYINTHYKLLSTKPTWNLGWPTDIAFESVISKLKDINYNPVVVDLHKDKVWKDTTSFSSNITEAIVDGDISFWVSWENASYIQDDARAIQMLRDAMDSAGAAIGAHGFRKPNSRVKQLQEESIYKYQLERESKNREIMKSLISYAKEYLQAGIEAGSSLENIYADFTSAYNSFLVKAKIQAVEIYKARLEAEVIKLDGLIKVALYELDFNIESAEQEVARINGILDTFNADVEYNKISNERTAYYVDVYNTFVSAYNARVAFIKTQIENKTNEINSNLKKIELSFHQYNTSLGLTLQGLSSTIDAAATAMAAATTSQITLNK